MLLLKMAARTALVFVLQQSRFEWAPALVCYSTTTESARVGCKYTRRLSQSTA